MENKFIYNECAKCVGKIYQYDNGLYYRHGKPVQMEITGVKIGNYGVSVLNSLTFEDGFKSCKDAYSVDGERFIEEYNILKNRRFKQISGYHKGETFESFGLYRDRTGVYVRCLWDCGAYIYEPVEKFVNGTFEEILNN